MSKPKFVNILMTTYGENAIVSGLDAGHTWTDSSGQTVKETLYIKNHFATTTSIIIKLMIIIIENKVLFHYSKIFDLLVGLSEPLVFLWLSPKSMQGQENGGFYHGNEAPKPSMGDTK
jgi:hypothetical protein